MISKYIDNKELKRAIEDGKLKPFRIRKILKDQGIILASTNSEQIAEQVYPILWGNCDIEKLSQSLDDGANYIKSSVMEMEIKDSDNIMDDLEDFFGNASFGMTRYGLSAVSRVNDDKLIVKLRYSIIRPGRNEFISTQYKNTDIITKHRKYRSHHNCCNEQDRIDGCPDSKKYIISCLTKLICTVQSCTNRKYSFTC